MNRKKELLLVILFATLVVIIGVISVITALALGLELNVVDPVHAYTHHLGNWLVWFIFGIALAVGIALFMYFKKK